MSIASGLRLYRVALCAISRSRAIENCRLILCSSANVRGTGLGQSYVDQLSLAIVLVHIQAECV